MTAIGSQGGQERSTEERRCDGIAMGPEGSNRVQDVIDTLEELTHAHA